MQESKKRKIYVSSFKRKFHWKYLFQHEQELETQRLTQKCSSFEEQVAELQENELKAIRELEQVKLHIVQTQEEALEKASFLLSP